MQYKAEGNVVCYFNNSISTVGATAAHTMSQIGLFQTITFVSKV